MVNVRTVIKGLCRWFDSKRTWFWRYLTVQDLLVGSSAVFSSGNVADERILRGFGSNSWGFEVRAGRPGWGCLDLVISYWWEGVIAERQHYWREFRSINDFILQNWGACVDTVFGHVSLDVYLELMRCRSAGRDVVTSLQKSCWWGLMPMRKRQGMAKSRSGDGFVPMTGEGGCRWLWEMICRWSWMRAQELSIDSWWCTDRLWKIIYAFHNY